MPEKPKKNPPPSLDECAEVWRAVAQKLGEVGPVLPLEQPPYLGGAPEPDDVATAFCVDGVTEQMIVDAYVTVGQYGGKFTPTGYAENSRLRTANFVVNHWLSQWVARAFTLGVPIPTEAEATNPPLPASYSERELERRAALNPPQKYDGALAYQAADAAIWEPEVARSMLAMAADRKWGTVNPTAQFVLAKNMMGKGLPYDISRANDLSQFNAGQTAAEILFFIDPVTAANAGITGPTD